MDKPNTVGNPNKNAVKEDLAKDKAPHASILSNEAIKHSGKDDNLLHPGIKSVQDGATVIRRGTRGNRYGRHTRARRCSGPAAPETQKRR